MTSASKVARHAPSEPTDRRQAGISFIHRPAAGPTVVFLHGIGSNATSFRPLIPHLPDQWNLIVWNAPGYLGSDRLPDPWPLPDDYANALARFLDDLGIFSAQVVGHSLGTLIATAFARAYPDRVDALVLSSAASGHAVPPGGQIPERVSARIEGVAQQGPAAFAAARAAKLVHDPARHADVVARVEAAMAQIDPPGYTQAARMLASGDLDEMLRDVTIRPGFIIGTEDQITPVAQTMRAADSWANRHEHQPRVITIDDAGHAVYLQKPKAFAAALETLLSPNTADMAQPREGG